eukprot:3390019-Amphidinium_carterae.1
MRSVANRLQCAVLLSGAGRDALDAGRKTRKWAPATLGHAMRAFSQEGEPRRSAMSRTGG